MTDRIGKAAGDLGAALIMVLPGLMLSAVLAMAANFISIGYGGPTILFALLLGMAFNFASAETRYAPGLHFAAKEILRIGVALLGARITAAQIDALGMTTLAGVAASVALTILFGLLAAKAAGMTARLASYRGRRRYLRRLGSRRDCGGAASRRQPGARHGLHHHWGYHPEHRVHGDLSVSGEASRVKPRAIGDIPGRRLHDVAQVVGAGYSISPETGDAATIVKLLRVALLLPVVVIVSLAERGRSKEEGERAKLIPGFLLAFIAIVALNSFALVPHFVQSAMSDASRWCIVISIAALGVKTSLAELAKVGHRAVMLMVLETAFLATLVMTIVRLGYRFPHGCIRPRIRLARRRAYWNSGGAADAAEWTHCGD